MIIFDNFIKDLEITVEKYILVKGKATAKHTLQQRILFAITEVTAPPQNTRILIQAIDEPLKQNAKGR
jgi:hypothetical protein